MKFSGYFFVDFSSFYDRIVDLRDRRKRELKMTLNEKSLFLASMGVTVYHLWDWMDTHGLPTMDAAVEHYYDHHYGDL